MPRLKTTDPDYPVALTMRRGDLGQILDCIEVRLQTWIDTVAYWQGGLDADGSQTIEECSSEEEAQRMVQTYTRLKHIIEEVLLDYKENG